MRTFLCAVFESEKQILKATKTLKEKNIPIFDIYAPYAVHGLDEAMEIRRSRLPIICFFAGGIGFLFSLLFQIWVFTRSWPIIVGGKPYNAVPTFIPVSFEMTILFGGVVTALAFFFRSQLFPGNFPRLFDEAATDDRFILAIEKKNAQFDFQKLESLIKNFGASEVKVREVPV